MECIPKLERIKASRGTEEDSTHVVGGEEVGILIRYAFSRSLRNQIKF